VLSQTKRDAVLCGQTGGRWSAALAAILLLASCGDPFLSVCHSCVKGDPAQPVSATEAAKIGLVYSGKRLPKSASNIYYAEECGIDCAQWIRFDVPIADARAFANGLLDVPIGTNKAPLADITGVPLKWWTSVTRGTAEQGGNEIGAKGQPIQIWLKPQGATATVWVFAFTT
jgi:hypothetical protein